MSFYVDLYVCRRTELIGELVDRNGLRSGQLALQSPAGDSKISIRKDARTKHLLFPDHITNAGSNDRNPILIAVEPNLMFEERHGDWRRFHCNRCSAKM